MKTITYCDFRNYGVFAQDNNTNTVSDNYTKKEVHIKMRDGASFYTVIYTPKDHLKIPNDHAAYAIVVLLTVLTNSRKALALAKP
jgi:predicted acyl esterase